MSYNLIFFQVFIPKILKWKLSAAKSFVFFDFIPFQGHYWSDFPGLFYDKILRVTLQRMWLMPLGVSINITLMKIARAILLAELNIMKEIWNTSMFSENWKTILFLFFYQWREAKISLMSEIPSYFYIKFFLYVFCSWEEEKSYCSCTVSYSK